MTRKRKTTLGLGQAAALLLVSLLATPAMAQQGKFTADGPVTLAGVGTAQGGPLTLTATQTGPESSNVLTVFGSKVHCANAIYTGHQQGVTPHALISSGATQVTITPHYGKCTLFGKPATVDMNGCDYVFDFEGTTGAAKFGVKTTVVCPVGKHVQVTMFESEAKHTEASSFCTLTLTESAAGYSGLSASYTEAGQITISGSIEGMTVHENSEAALCAEATTTGAELHLDVQVEGRDAEGTVKPITVSDSGALAWGEGVGSSNALTINGGKTHCQSVILTGHKYNVLPNRPIENGVTTITLTPHYINCSWGGVLPIGFDMNGCHYVLHIGSTVGGVAGTYALTLDIVCPAPQEIGMTLFANATKQAENKPFCKVDIPAQTGFKGLRAMDTGNGHLDIAGTLKGVHVRSTSIEPLSLCPTTTTTSGSEFDFDFTVEGLNDEGAPTHIAISH
jgi:hypothetical protein